MFWQCTECGHSFNIDGEDVEAEGWSVECCGIEHVWPMGIVEQRRPVHRLKRRRTPRKKVPPLKLWPHGDVLKELLEQLGARQTKGCQCRALIHHMNVLGPRCMDFKRQIVAHLQKAYDHSTWADAVTFRVRAAATGIAWELKDWNDPIGSLVDLAIERASDRPCESPE